MTAQLEKWLQLLAAVPAHEFIEIHVDDLSADLATPANWIGGTFKYLGEATARCPAVQGIVCAAFSLVGRSEFVGANYRSCAELSREFDLTPPSLYYFGKEAMPWSKFPGSFLTADVSDFPAHGRRWSLLHLEYLPKNEAEYRRSLWVVPRVAVATDGEGR